MESDHPAAVYHKVLIKISGEALMGKSEFGLDPPTVESVCPQIGEVKALGIELGLVVGGGNIFRGLRAVEKGMDRTTADNMGMLATVITALAMRDRLENMGAYTPVRSPG